MENRVNVCIVDDDEIYQYTMSCNLENLNSIRQIKAFSDGAEAIDFMLDNLNAQNELPDVIFLDINMPIMDGYQFMEEYVKIKPKVGKKITIYMVSSSVDPVDIEKVKRINEISDYIIKPINDHQLKAIIAALENTIN